MDKYHPPRMLVFCKVVTYHSLGGFAPRPRLDYTMSDAPLPIIVQVTPEGNQVRLTAHHLPATQLHAILLQFAEEFGLVVGDLEDFPGSAVESLEFTVGCADGSGATVERLARLRVEKELDNFWPGTQLEFSPPLGVGDLPAVDS